MAKFRKKPVVIEARQLGHGHDEDMEIVRWCGGRAITTGIFFLGDEDVVLAIDTLEGTHTANHDDWIIKGVKGEFYPCKPDIFAATYEPADV